MHYIVFQQEELDYGSLDRKIQIMAENPPEMTFPTPVGLPPFSKKSFRNYDEMNAWKREYLKEIAARGGIQWKRS